MPVALRVASGAGVVPADAALWRTAMALLEGMEDDLMAALLTAMRGWPAAVQVARLTELVATQDVDAIVDLVAPYALRNPAVPTMRQAIASAMASVMTAERVAMMAQFFANPVRYSALHPAVQDAAERRVLLLTTTLREQARTTIGNALLRGIEDGVNPAETARRMHQTGALSLSPRGEQAVASYRAALEGGPRAAVYRNALQRALRDRRSDRTIERAIRDGAPLDPAQIDAMVARYADKMRRYEASVVARTETLQSYHDARLALWREQDATGILTGQLRKRWVLALDERTCPVCKTIAASQPDNGVPLAGVFPHPDGRMLDGPVAHPQCRCILVLDFTR